jgi:alkylation response protein AidB-like acyl-CoA dehydrogenase
MNLNDTPQQAEFRAQVRQWIATEVPASLKNLRQAIVQGPGISHEKLKPIEDALAAHGWTAPAWPKEFGGAGLDVGQMVIFYEECAKAGMPDHHTSGLDMLGPILMRYGTDAQKKKFLGPTAKGEIIWAQGYSEPQAGSDLAGLGLKCEITPDGFLLNGQKIWTSKAHEADWLFVLARTDPKVKKKQDGISFLLVKQDTPGIDIRPIRTMDGFTHFCETFFENVKVPRENLVGELHKGWEVAKALLGHERFTHPTGNPTLHLNALENLKADARQIEEGDGAVWDNPVLRRKVAALEMDVDCLKYTRYRALTKVEQGQPPGAEAQILKMFGAELMQRIVEAHQEVAGQRGLTWDETGLGNGAGEVARHGANIRAATIRGGTSEVQRNVISKRVLNLPEVKTKVSG